MSSTKASASVTKASASSPSLASYGSMSGNRDEPNTNAEDPKSRQKIHQKPQVQRDLELKERGDKDRKDKIIREKARKQRGSENPSLDQRKICGVYNYAGCYYSAEKCKFAHVFDTQAGSEFYQCLAKKQGHSEGFEGRFPLPS